MTPIGFAALPILQGIEHHGLIIEVNNGYYYTHYYGREVCLNFRKNKEDILNEMINCCNHYDSRKAWTHKEKIPENTTIETINNIIKELKVRFSSNNYDTIKNNCQLYVKAILMKINGRDLPKSIYSALLHRL